MLFKHYILAKHPPTVLNIAIGIITYLFRRHLLKCSAIVWIRWMVISFQVLLLLAYCRIIVKSVISQKKDLSICRVQCTGLRRMKVSGNKYQERNESIVSFATLIFLNGFIYYLDFLFILRG
jgi:type VI protein secretion system component VasK